MTNTTNRLPRTNVAPEGTPTSKLGFPVTTCTRCGGTGQYPSAAYRGVCLKCSGTGSVDYNQSSRRQRLAYEAAVAEAQAATPEDIAVGDTIMAPYGMAGRKWAKVTAVEISEPRHCGSCLIGTNEADRRFAIQQFTISTAIGSLTFQVYDGDEAIEGSVRRWTGRMDPAPFLAKINYNAR